MTLSLDDVLSEFRKDSKIDQIMLDTSALSLPNLTSKYLDFQSQFKKQLRELNRRKKAFPMTERRGNEEFNQLEELIAQQEDGIDACVEMLRAINQMSYSISSAVKWRQFVNGAPSDIL